MSLFWDTAGKKVKFDIFLGMSPKNSGGSLKFLGGLLSYT